MRLLDTTTKKIKNFPHSVPAYAILSHRWREEEVLFQDLNRLDVSSLQGWAKLSGACDFVRSYGCKYLWMDTCCIDKTSSAELTESLNSMYKWYKKSAFCVAYLDNLEADDSSRGSLRSADWFTRGWTLQELIAPGEVIFTARDWSVVGTKTGMSKDLMDVSGVEESVLKSGRMDDIPVTRKLTWASTRETSKIEDQAYSLMGLFDVTMPTIYGEGNNAFMRLQEEIIKKHGDHSIFAWGMVRQVAPGEEFPIPSDDEISQPQFRIGLLADSPEPFQESEPLHIISMSELSRKLGKPDLDGEITVTNYGTRIRPAMIPIDHSRGVYVALLPCEDESGNVLGIYLKRIDGTLFARVGSYVAPDLLSIPYENIDSSKIEVPDRIYVTRDPPASFAVSILAMVDGTSLAAFCASSGFTLQGKGSLSELNDWDPSPGSDCSFDVQELGPTFVLLQKKSAKLGLLLAFTIEPSRHQHAEPNLFSVKVCVIAEKGKGQVPYTDDSSREAVQKIVEFWKTTQQDTELPISHLTGVDIPDHGRLELLLMCETEPNWKNVDSYNDCKYTLTTRWKGVAQLPSD